MNILRGDNYIVPVFHWRTTRYIGRIGSAALGLPYFFLFPKKVDFINF